MISYRARRATTDDLAQLLALWQASQFPALELEKRFTEFQIVEDAEGKLVGAIGLQISGLDANIHSETYADFGLTDTLRPMLWERIQIVSKNHGLFRLWTNESAPFWKKDAGFAEPSSACAQKLPEAFEAQPRSLLMLQFRNESASPVELEKQLAAYLRSEHEKRSKLMRRAKAMNITVTVLAALLLLAIVALGVQLLMTQQH